jgi:hypothetical protein
MGPGAEPAVHRRPGAVGHHIQQPAALQLHQAGDVPSRCSRVALRKLVSSSPATPSKRSGSSTSGRPRSVTARMMVAQPTPRSRATAATAWASLPTRRHASAWARSVSTSRGRIAATCSVQVPTPQAGSGQRQSRLRQHSTTGHPPAGRSRTPDRAAAMGLGPHATVWAADHFRRGLDHQPPLTARHLRGEDIEAVQAKQSEGRGTTVLTYLEPPPCWTSDIRKLCEVPGLF